MDMGLIKEMYMNLLFLYHFRVMVCLKTDGGVLKVRLSEELAMIVLDPNGGKYNLNIIFHGVSYLILSNLCYNHFYICMYFVQFLSKSKNAPKNEGWKYQNFQSFTWNIC